MYYRSHMPFPKIRVSCEIWIFDLINIFELVSCDASTQWRSNSLALFFRSNKELYYIKVEYIIKLYKAFSKHSRTKLLQISIPNLGKKLNKRSHRHTLSKQAENQRPKNNDQHPLQARMSKSSSFLRLSSSFFCHDEEERLTPIYPIQNWLTSAWRTDFFSQALHHGWI